MMMNERNVNVESLVKALKCVQELRASVSVVFEKLGGGLKGPDGTIVRGDKDATFLSEIRECLTAVNNDVDMLDKAANSVQIPTVPFTLGSPSLLTLDPLLERSPIYQQVVQTYKWTSKVHNHAAYAMSMLHNNMPKRSYLKRLQRPASVCQVPTPNADAMIRNTIRFYPDMNIIFSHPLGSPTMLQISVGRTLKALVAFRGLAIEWVVIKAYHEDFTSENGKIDLWSPSKHIVFQKLTQHALSAALHFTSMIQIISDSCLRQYLSWLNTYKTLFSTSCNKCGRMLQDFLPPTWHDYRTMEAYHEHCRP